MAEDRGELEAVQVSSPGGQCNQGENAERRISEGCRNRISMIWCDFDDRAVQLGAVGAVEAKS